MNATSGPKLFCAAGKASHVAARESGASRMMPARYKGSSDLSWLPYLNLTLYGQLRVLPESLSQRRDCKERIAHQYQEQQHLRGLTRGVRCGN